MRGSLLHPRRAEIIAWLDRLNIEAASGKPWRYLFDVSYGTWARNGRAWDRRLATGGTLTLCAIMWYQHVARPGSTDSRPGIILTAICAHLDEITQAQAPNTDAS